MISLFHRCPDRPLLYTLAGLYCLLCLAPSGALGKQWVFLCGSQQSKWALLDADQTPEQGDQTSHDSCLFCMFAQLQVATPAAQRLPDAPVSSACTVRSDAPASCFDSMLLARHAPPRAPPFML